jgi:hypothetical protein
MSGIAGYQQGGGDLTLTRLGAADKTTADFQSDTGQYGRGERHLSAALVEGDVVAYQTGTWLVDGVPVGDGSPAPIQYCCIETMQVVWTHNCEHGVLRGQELVGVVVAENTTKNPVVLRSMGEMIEFGPEQLLACIPVDWMGNDNDGEVWILRDCIPLVELHAEWILKE